MSTSRKDRICALLKAIETGDPEAVTVVDEDRYIQHNPETREGSEGLAELFKRLSKMNPKVNIVRVFEDGDYVFLHTEYDFGSPKVGFEVFRFDGDKTVEHWDNIQPRQGPNPSGHDMVGGPTEAIDLELTEANRELVRAFVSEIFVDRGLDRLETFLDPAGFVQHSPTIADGIDALRESLNADVSAPDSIEYARIHRLLAEGNFVLCVSEDSRGGAHTSFYDLYRVAGGRLVEHWDTVEALPPRSEWKNDNGKF